MNSSGKDRLLKKFEELAARNSAFVIHNDPQFTAEDFAKIGITALGPQLTPGYIKLYAEDFVVEEITLKGDFCTVGEDEDTIHVNHAKDDSNQYFIQATVVKKNMSTLDTQEILAKELELPLRSVNFAGIKDALAVTSQRFSFDLRNLEKIARLNVPDMYLKDFAKTRGRVFVGQLLGNRFTILVRTKTTPDEKRLAEVVEQVKQKGFPNFYNLQRFGPRLITHEVGQKIIERDYEGSMKLFITKTSHYEIPYITLLRRKMADLWGNWQALEETMNEIPDYFGHELDLVRTLIASNGSFTDAFSKNERLTSIYYSAYVSYIFNQLLSEQIASGKIDAQLPLLSNEPEVLELYKPFLEKDGLELETLTVPELPFIDNLIKPRTFPTTIVPGDLKYKTVDEGVIFSFILPKASYATSLLSYLFELHEGLPKPEWLMKTRYENLKEEMPSLAEKFSIPEETSEE